MSINECFTDGHVLFIPVPSQLCAVKVKRDELKSSQTHGRISISLSLLYILYKSVHWFNCRCFPIFSAKEICLHILLGSHSTEDVQKSYRQCSCFFRQGIRIYKWHWAFQNHSKNFKCMLNRMLNDRKTVIGWDIENSLLLSKSCFSECMSMLCSPHWIFHRSNLILHISNKKKIEKDLFCF